MAILLAVGLWMAAVSAIVALRARGITSPTSPPVLTVTCASIVAAISLAQLAINPALLPGLMRTESPTLAAEPWRLVTSLVVQDDGWQGFAFNLGGLLVVGSLAERLLGRPRWAMIAAVSVAVAQASAVAWQPIGAGNSILNFGLAGGICADCLWRHRSRPVLLPSVVASGCFAALFLVKDIHGAAGVTGAMIASAFVITADRGGKSRPRT
jgi:hypothetical protein